jgi:hypothetical protein
VRPYLSEKTKKKKTGGMSEVVEVLNSIPSTNNNNKKEFRRWIQKRYTSDTFQGTCHHALLQSPGS